MRAKSIQGVPVTGRIAPVVVPRTDPPPGGLLGPFPPSLGLGLSDGGGGGGGLQPSPSQGGGGGRWRWGSLFAPAINCYIIGIQIIIDPNI